MAQARVGEALALTEVAPEEVFQGAPHSEQAKQPQQGPNVVCMPHLPGRFFEVPSHVRDLPSSNVRLSLKDADREAVRL